MEKAAQIVICPKMCLNSIMLSIKEKEQLLKRILILCVQTKEKITECDVLNEMTKRLKQVKSNSKGIIRKAATGNHVGVKCLNCALWWELAFVNAECNQMKCDIPVL